MNKNMYLKSTKAELICEIEKLQALQENANEVAVVIPYVKDFAQGEELKNAMRAWEKNLQHHFKIIVIGDKEDWFSDKVIHIAHKRKTDNPPLDIAAKMMVAIESEHVPNGFIWTNDDIYPINPVFVHDIMVLKAVGNLKAIQNFPKNLFGANMKKTIAVLEKAKLSTWNYSTHTPVWFYKAELKEVIEKYNLLKDSHLIQSLYFNHHYSDCEPIILHVHRNTWKLGIYRKDPDLKKMYAYLKNRKFFNHSRIGFIPEVKKMLSDRFSTKSKFEK